MNEDMHLSDAGLHFLANEEGIRLYVYDDKQPGAPMYKGGKVKGTLTFGMGHALKPGDPWKVGVTYTIEQVYEQKRKDLAVAESIVRKYIKVRVSQKLWDMLVSMAFNLGEGQFSRATFVARINAKRSIQAVCEAWWWWNLSKGEPILTGRRHRETNYAFSGLPLTDPASR